MWDSQKKYIDKTFHQQDIQVAKMHMNPCSTSHMIKGMQTNSILLCVLSHFSCVCDPVDWSLPCSSVYELLQTRILEWVAISFARESSSPGMEPTSLVSAELAGGFFTAIVIWEAITTTLLKIAQTRVLMTKNGGTIKLVWSWSSVEGAEFLGQPYLYFYLLVWYVLGWWS